MDPAEYERLLSLDHDLGSLSLNGEPVAWAIALDNDTVLAKFDRAEVRATLEPGESVELTLPGLWVDGGSFAGTDVMQVIRPGP